MKRILVILLLLQTKFICIGQSDIDYYMRGNAKLALQDMNGAINDYSKAIELNPLNYKAYYNRGLTYQRIDQCDLAIADYTKSLSIDSTQISPIVNRGICKSQNEDWQSAMQDFNNALSKDPQHAIALFQRAFVYIKTQNPKSAIVDCNKFLRTEKDHGRALLIRGTAKLMQDKRKSGCKDIEKAVLSNVPDAKEIFNAGCCGDVHLDRISTQNGVHLLLRHTQDLSPSSTSLNEVTIGTQVWSSKNLDLSTFRNGDSIPQAKTDDEWKAADMNKQPAWCYYKNDPENGTKYGKLYNWYAVIDPRGLAPEGFHIPSDEEWELLSEELAGFLNNESDRGEELEVGTKMKSENGWIENGNGFNSSGFSGLPGGVRYHDGSFFDIGSFGCWWSSEEDQSGDLDAYYWRLTSEDGYFDGQSDEGKLYGFSVRCLRD
jgi:uncharacterized protein (TIGR02145 family)